MPADPFVLGIANGLNEFQQNLRDVQNQNDDRAYKSLVAQMMIRKQIMDERQQGYHGGYGSPTDQPAPATPSTDMSVPQVYLPNGGGINPSAVSAGATGSRVAAPAVNVQAPTVGLRGAAGDTPTASLPTGFGGFLSRLVHSGPYAGRGLPTLPDLGPVNGLTEDQANAQQAEAARRADIAQGQAFTAGRDATQHGYDMERQSDEDAAAMARAKLAQAGENARSARSDDKVRTTELEKALTEAQVDLDASARNVQSVINGGGSDADVAAAKERYKESYDRVTTLRGMIGNDIGLPEAPKPLDDRTNKLARLNGFVKDALKRAPNDAARKQVWAKYFAALKDNDLY